MSKAKKRKQRKPSKCPVCGKKKPDLTWGPNPYAGDIYGDSTPVWMCGDCRHESAMDI